MMNISLVPHEKYSKKYYTVLPYAAHCIEYYWGTRFEPVDLDVTFTCHVLV